MLKLLPMFRWLLFIPFCLLCTQALSQSNPEYIFNNSGAQYSGNGYEVVTSFGESYVEIDTNLVYCGFLIPDTVIKLTIVPEWSNSQSHFSIFPNPCKDYFSLVGDISEEPKVFDSLGREIYLTKQNKNNYRLPPNCNAGLYFIHLRKDNLVLIKKLQVVN